MTNSELNCYATLIDDAVRGKWVTVMCRDMRWCRNACRDVMSICDGIGLPYEAVLSNNRNEVIIGSHIWEGGIDFRTRHQEMMMCGDPRDRR